jgi:integrase
MLFSDAKTNLRVFTREELQDFLEAKARQRLSESVLKHLRWDLRQIFEMAVAEGHLSRNPARLLFTPRSLTGSTKLIMNMEEVNECFRVLPLRERLIVKMAILAGMRPGEILGLTWSAVAACRGICPNTRPEAWVFASEKGKTPLWRDCLWRRSIQPRLKTVGLEWASFQVMRRTHSTLMNELLVDPKIVADQLGHTVDVNQNVYTKAGLHRRQAAVNSLDQALRKTLMEPNGAMQVQGNV